VSPQVPAWSEAPWSAIQQSVLSLQNQWLDHQRAGTACETSGTDNYNTQALVEAAYQSAETGTTVKPRRWK